MKRYLIVILCILVSQFVSSLSWAGVGSGFCESFQLEEIPVGNFFQPLTGPINPLRITQAYNTSKSEGYCQEGGQASADSIACKGKQIYYGHDGLDLHPKGASSGKTDIYAVQPGLVIASHKSGSFSGWGESLILATRTNLYSEEILTFHYHHLHASFTPSYATSRLYQACDQVVRGAVIAKEGGTPNWPTHLHFSIKRWKNLEELKNKITKSPGQFYGYGYVYSDQSKLVNFLDPEAWLFDYFEEFRGQSQSYASWQWSNSFALGMRYLGWFFGDFDGRFGVDLPVKRREAARWLKQAARIKSVSGTTPYTDLLSSDSDLVYVKSLLDYGKSVKIFNPASICQGKSYQFCPDQSLTRAEAVKIVVAGLFQDEFLEVYDNWVWKNTGAVASQILSHFEDVSPSSWVAPYLYLAWQKGLTGESLKFNPNLPITRAEFAKWLVLSYQLKNKLKPNACQTVVCQAGYYCDAGKQSCQKIPTCIPDSNQACPLGGGNLTGSSTGKPQESSSPQASMPDENQSCQCKSGLCCDGCQLRSTNSVCLSDQEFRCSGSPGAQFTEKRFIHQLCDGKSTGCNGALLIDSWKNGQLCSQGQVCQESSGQASCQNNQSVCSQTWFSYLGQNCFNNPNKTGQPQLCLETRQNVASSWDWRVCKTGGIFLNNYQYELIDLSHLNKYLGKYQAAGGASCSPWQNVGFSYLNSSGPQNGASLQVQVSSPQGCQSSGCTYFTGQTLVYHQCKLSAIPPCLYYRKAGRNPSSKYIRVFPEALWLE